MAIAYTIKYASEVVAKDIPALSSPIKHTVRRAIEQKLTTSPETFGKPLRRSLHGYRSLRIGDYRVVFRIIPTKHEVLVLFIGHRSTIYKTVGSLQR